MSGMRGVALISIGTILGQALVLLTTPIISRLFTPQDLGHLSVYVSLVGMFSTTAALCYELAIPLPSLSKNAAIVSFISVLAVMATTVAACLVLMIGHGRILSFVGAADLLGSRYWVPVGLLLTGIGTVLTLNTVRYRAYGRNALSKILQGGVQAFAQVSAGVIGFGWLGLIVGQILGLIAGILPLLSPRYWLRGPVAPRVLLRRSWSLARKYRNFPLMAAPSTLVNSAAGNIPALLLASFFGLQVVGFYGLGLRVLQLPARFLGQSLSQVFLGESADALRRKRLSSFVDPAYRSLIAAALHVFIPIAILARPVFSLVFGAVWEQAGAYVQYLMPWVMVGFVSTPLSMLVTVLQRQRQELWLQCAYVVVIAGSLSCGAVLSNPTLGILLFGIFGGAFLAWKIWWLLGIAGCRRKELLAATMRELLLSVLVNLPLVLLVILSRSNLLTCAIGSTWALMVQWINLRVRRVYAF